MIEKLSPFLKAAKFITLTLTDCGDDVMISATIRPKDGSEAEAPLQVKTSYSLADILLLEALKKPPKAGKTATVEEKKEENETADLFGEE